MNVDEFPIEVRHLMLYRQQEQEGKRDWSEFQDCRMGGFEWDKTPEKYAFWSLVINREEFNVFYAKYPKVKYPKDMPEEIKMLALDRRVEQGWLKEHELTFGFKWSTTPENDEFWKQIHNKNYSVYYEKYGHPTKTNTSTPSYKGEIKDFPPEVVELMLQRQFEQTGERNISVFEADRIAGIEYKGFTWSDAIEGYYFWDDVIGDKKFDIFFKKYPKESLINSQIKTKQNEKSSRTKTSSKAIEVSTVVATISTGKRPTSVGISGRRSKTAIGSGHISYKAVIGC